MIRLGIRQNPEFQIQRLWRNYILKVGSLAIALGAALAMTNEKSFSILIRLLFYGQLRTHVVVYPTDDQGAQKKK
jgi:hypothetical protein